MSQFSDLINQGLSECEAEFGEKIRLEGREYACTFSDQSLSVAPIDGGMEHNIAALAIIRKSLLSNKPEIGRIAVRRGVEYLIESVTDDVAAWHLGLSNLS